MERERGRERERETETETMNKLRVSKWFQEVLHLAALWSLLALCVEPVILALGCVGSWQEAWKLFKRYDLNNDDVLSPPLPQDLSIGSFISMAHDLY